MSGLLRLRLSLMMFLQYAIWGAWAPVLWDYLVSPRHLPAGAAAGAVTGLGFSPDQAGWIFGALWLACIVAMFGGQVADRWMPTQWFLAIVHLLGGGVMLLMAREHTFPMVMLLMSIYSLLYAPTLALTNSLSFRHLKEAEKQFGSIRVWGTIGWIVAGWLLTVWRSGGLGLQSAVSRGDSLMLAGVASLIMGVFCMLLPHTPPKKEAVNPWAFVEAFRLFKDRSFAIFMVIAFIVTTELQFYYLPTASFLKDIGVAPAKVPMTMTTAQIAEIVAMALFLPLLLPRIGVRWALAIGVIAWPIRYVFFAIGQPLWLVIASLTLHGIGYTFFFVVSQIYVDEVAPDDIRASAQSLLYLMTLGIGNFLGTRFTAYIVGKLTVDGQANWTWIFLVPCFLTVACAIAFLLFFRPPRKAVAHTVG